MRRINYILLGAVMAIVLICSFGFYDSDNFQHSPYYFDGYGPYIGTDGDSQFKWNSAGAYLDWNITGDLDLDLVGTATMDFSAATDSSGGFKVTANVPTGQQLYGAIYGLAHIEGTTDGVVSALRGRIDMDSSSAPTSQVHGARINVQEVGADLSGATVVGLFVETLLDATGNDPAAHYMMRFNTSQGAEVPTAWIMASNPESIAYTANTVHGASDTDKVGAIKIHVGGATGVIYLYCYDHPGQ